VSTPSAPGDCLLTYDDGAARWLTINRPDVHNALNGEVLAALDRALDEVVTTTRIRAIVITGIGERAFSAGADLDELAGAGIVDAEAVLERGGRVLAKLAALPVASIAAVNGLALGGGFELALACTFILASESASFGLPETGLGLMPGYGGTQRLPRQVPAQAARLMVLTGERVDAVTAFRYGLLLAAPSPPDALSADVRSLAGRLAGRGPSATAHTLDALRAAGEVPLAAGLAIERSLAAKCIASPEAAEGIAAFKARRTPDFGGRRGH
jgi:enoyl-CoA hydratase